MALGKCLIVLLSPAAAALAFCLIALTVLDVTNEAKPSRAESWLARSVLQMKVRAQMPRQPSRFMTTEGDLERASTMYQDVRVLSWSSEGQDGALGQFIFAAPATIRDTAIRPRDVDGRLRDPTWNPLDRHALVSRVVGSGRMAPGFVRGRTNPTKGMKFDRTRREQQ